MTDEGRLLLGTHLVMEADPITGASFLKCKISGLVFEDDTNALTEISYEHYRIHQGEMYLGSFVTGSVANSGNVDLLISTLDTDKECHAAWRVDIGGEAWVYLYENVTGSSNGVQISAPNMNRTSSNTPETKIYTGPTLTNLGIRLSAEHINGGSGPQSAGGSVRTETEWILDARKLYAIRCNNVSGNTKNAGILIQFYEEDE